MVTVLERRLVDELHEQGWVVLRRAVGPPVIGRVRDAMQRCFRTRDEGRLTNAWTRLDAVRDLAVDPSMIAIASSALGGRAVAFQTLGFRVGTTQAPHADTIHFDTVPSGGVCAVWVALEDVGIDQGPVLVYSGSHLWPVETPTTLGLDPSAFDASAYEDAVRRRLDERGATSEAVAMEAGDVLVWAANLVHGGAPRVHGTTRWSQVTHYVRAGELLVTPMRSRVEDGCYAVRPVVDVADGRIVRPGPSAPVVLHTPGRAVSRVGGDAIGVWRGWISTTVGSWREVRAKAALARAGFRDPLPG